MKWAEVSRKIGGFKPFFGVAEAQFQSKSPYKGQRENGRLDVDFDTSISKRNVYIAILLLVVGVFAKTLGVLRLRAARWRFASEILTKSGRNTDCKSLEKIMLHRLQYKAQSALVLVGLC